MFVGADAGEVLENPGGFRGEHTVGRCYEWVEELSASFTDGLVFLSFLGLLVEEYLGRVLSLIGGTVEVGNFDINYGVRRVHE